MEYSTLPTEIKESILLQVPKEDLLNVREIDSQSRNICSTSSFWKERFQQEGLLFLFSGYDFPSWYRVYQQNLWAKTITSRLLKVFLEKINKEKEYRRDRFELASFDPSRVTDLSIFRIGDAKYKEGIFFLDAWKYGIYDEYKNEERDLSRISMQNYDLYYVYAKNFTIREGKTRLFTRMYCDCSGTFEYDKKRNEPYVSLCGKEIRNLNIEDIRLLCYKLTFFGVIIKPNSAIYYDDPYTRDFP